MFDVTILSLEFAFYGNLDGKNYCGMATPRVLVVRAPGTNCDVETAFAFEMAGAQPARLHVNQLIENPTLASGFQILCFPGGFSYGDDIAAGRILATQLQNFLSDMLEVFKQSDRLVIGICNGFQVMMRLGIFFENGNQDQPATLTWNQQGRFEDRWVNLKPVTSNCPFLRDIDQIYLPMAHAEGRFLFRDEEAKKAIDCQQPNRAALLRRSWCDRRFNSSLPRESERCSVQRRWYLRSFGTNFRIDASPRTSPVPDQSPELDTADDATRAW